MAPERTVPPPAPPQVAEIIEEPKEEDAVAAADIVQDDEISDIQGLSGIVESTPSFWNVLSMPLQTGRPGLWKHGLPFAGFVSLGLICLSIAVLAEGELRFLYWVSAIPFAEAVRHFTFSITMALRGELDTGMEKPKRFNPGGFIGSFIVVFISLGLALGIARFHAANIQNLPAPGIAYAFTVAISGLFILSLMIIIADACAKEVKDTQFERPNVAQLAQQHWAGFSAVVGFIVVAIPFLIPGAFAASVMSMISAARFGRGKDAPEGEPLHWQIVRANAEKTYTRVVGKIDPEVETYASAPKHALGVLASGASGLFFGWIAVWYWAASATVRLLVLAYRGERLRFWSGNE